MNTKNILMGYCFLYAVTRFSLTTYQYFTGTLLRVPVLIIAESVSLIGIFVSIFWFMGKLRPRVLQGLLALNAAAMFANVLLTRVTPPSAGTHFGDIIIIGSIADVIILLAALILPMDGRRSRR